MSSRDSGVENTEAEVAVIHCEALGKTYAEGTLYTPVFDGLELTVHAGETVAILGASGAGKSTLLHLLGGLDTPTAGEVYVAGQKMSALSDSARGRLRNRARSAYRVRRADAATCSCRRRKRRGWRRFRQHALSTQGHRTDRKSVV